MESKSPLPLICDEKFFQCSSPIFVVCPETLCIKSANKQALSFYGYNKNEILNKKLSDIDYSEASLIAGEDMDLADIDPSKVYIHRVKNGVFKYVKITMTYVKYNGKDAILFIIIDVSDLKAYGSKDDITAENQRYIQDILDAQTLLVGVWEGLVLKDFNKSFAKFFHIKDIQEFNEVYPEPAVFLRTGRDCVIADDWYTLHSILLKNKQEGHKSKVAIQPYGESAPRVFLFDISEMGNNRFVISMADVTDIDNYTSRLIYTNHNLEKEIEKGINKIKAVDTELHTKEDILIQQSKMAVVGEMISMVAHQWKQPLNVISVLNQDLQYYCEEGKLNRDFILSCAEGVNKQINFVTDTINSFVSFFKPNSSNSLIYVIETIKSVELLLTPQFNKDDISIEYDISEDIGNDVVINGSSNSIKQVIMNIFVNAIYAIIENRGNSAIDKGIIKVKVYLKGDNVVISFADNGGGIQEDMIDKVFDSYVTSKGKNGTGIGLHLCKILVNNMKGTITATNYNMGAVFSMEFPVHDSGTGCIW